MNIVDIYESVSILDIYNKLDICVSGFTIDTRKIKKGDCYIGIKGEKMDGNTLFMEAFEKGATVAILDNFKYKEEILKYLKENDKSIIVVKDSIKFLGILAAKKRNTVNIPVIAVTGSAGKTSTKDMIYSVLNESFNAHKTIGNQNNHLGLPLTVLSLEEKNEVLVLEMGMNHLKEISYLTNIAKPDIAVITNVGTAHIGNLGSRKNILKAKLEILEGLKEDGIVIINNDNDLLHEWASKNNNKYNIITIGVDNDSDFRAIEIKEDESGSTFICNNQLYYVPVGGIHFIYNALVAIAVAKRFDISYDLVANGIKNFELSSNRMSIVELKKKDIKLIDDSYNANFDSMSYALKYLGSLMGRNIAVLGTMKELGDFSKNLHEDLGKIIASEGIDILITVGDDAKYINIGAEDSGLNKENSYHFNTNEEAVNTIKSIWQDDDNILIKASNSLNFKEIVELLEHGML